MEDKNDGEWRQRAREDPREPLKESLKMRNNLEPRRSYSRYELPANDNRAGHAFADWSDAF